MNVSLAIDASSNGVPDWRNLAPVDGVIREPVPDGQRLVLWLSGPRDGGFRYWERISIVPHTEFTVTPGVGAAAGVLLPARQRLGSLLSRLWQRWRGAGTSQTWLLPDGAVAEQCGERRTDILLVWAEGDTISLDAAWMQSRWPDGSRWQQLAARLFLVGGVEPPRVKEELAQTGECPRRLAEQRLATARRTGDRQEEALALADLGAMSLHASDVPRAITHLEEALTIAQALGNRPLEGDILSDLGLAVLLAGQQQRALELLEWKRGMARESGDRFAEKMALERLGLVYTRLPDLGRSLASFQSALSLARELGDHKHEAELLWLIGIQQAELGQREEAIASAGVGGSATGSGRSAGGLVRGALARIPPGRRKRRAWGNRDIAADTTCRGCLAGRTSDKTADAAGESRRGGKQPRLFAHGFFRSKVDDPFYGVRREDGSEYDLAQAVADLRGLRTPHGLTLSAVWLFHQCQGTNGARGMSAQEVDRLQRELTGGVTTTSDIGIPPRERATPRS